jgi:hypothetical protein
MSKQNRAKLDWSRLLGFEQLSEHRGTTRIGSKIGDIKEPDRLIAPRG